MMLLRLLLLLVSSVAMDAYPLGQFIIDHGPRLGQAGRQWSGESDKQLSGRFLHITDYHLDRLYHSHSDPAQVCHQPSIIQSLNTAGQFGRPMSICDTSYKLSNATLGFIKRRLSHVDFVIYTGDTLRHDRDIWTPRSRDESLSAHRAAVQNVRETFDLTRVKFIPTIGNNDLFEHDQIGPGPNSVLQGIYETWAPLGLNLTGDFLRGGYFRQDVPHPGSEGTVLTILSLNSVYFYQNNNQVSDCDHPNSAGAEQIRWVRGQLESARGEGRGVYLMTHIPPQDPQKEYKPKCLSHYVNVLGTYADIIRGHFSGHTNEDTLTLVLKAGGGAFKTFTLLGRAQPKDIDTDSIVLALTNAPSIVSVNNPAIRELAYLTDPDPKTFGTLLDYTQYYLELEEANKMGEASWKVEYVASEVYGIGSLTINDWREVLKSFQKRGSVLWSLYTKFTSVSSL